MFGDYKVAKPETAFQVVVWWELRRILYNFALIFFFFGTYIGFIAAASPHLAPGEDAIEPMAVFFLLPWYFGIANACYTTGWITELALRGNKFQNSSFRRKLFWGGMVFSFLITSIPFWDAAIYSLRLAFSKD